MPDALEIKALSAALEGRPVLQDIALSLSGAGIACLLGPSGAGKTTLLRCIAGFERPGQGEIRINGREVSGPAYHVPVEQRRVGMVFQDYALFPHLSVADNITFGLKKMAAGKVRRRLDELIALFSLGDYTDRFPHSLSGGQQQRVALARAMAPRPGLLLLDEPFASLDVELREQLARELRRILKQDGITTIMVSHNQLEAFAMADVIGVLQAGRLLQWGAALDLYHEPNCPAVADFVGEGVFIPGRVVNGREVSTEIGPIRGRLPAGLAPGAPVKVLIRPDDILHDDNSPMTACVKDKAFRGAAFLYTLETKSGLRLLSLVPSHHDHPLNEPLGIRPEVKHLVVFPRQ